MTLKTDFGVLEEVENQWGRDRSMLPSAGGMVVASTVLVTESWLKKKKKVHFLTCLKVDP